MVGGRTGKARKSYYKKKFFFSIRERLLLHLGQFTSYEGELEAPDELTQFGIADVVRAGRSTCSKLLQEMEDQGLLYGRRAHVPSGKIRRTVYFLTPRGQLRANRIREKVERAAVKVKTPEGDLKKLKVVDIPDEVPVYAPLVDVVAHISRGVFDVPSFVRRMKDRRRRVAYLGAMPRLRHFFDREAEREALRKSMISDDRRLTAVYGLPGVGKTTLAAKVVEGAKEDRHVFWLALREWSTVRGVLREIGEFLARLNRKELRMYVDTQEVLDMREVVFLLEGGLEDLQALLVFDDYDKAADALDPLFETLREVFERVEGPHAFVLSRTVPRFYGRADVKAKGSVSEVALEGMDREGARTLLTLKNIPEEAVDAIYARTQGHPLFMELLQGPDVTDARDVDRFLEEELLPRLNDVEQRVLELASVFRMPMHADALFLDDDVDFIVLTSLSDQSLLRESAPRVFNVHDVLRTFFYGRLSPSKRRRYHQWAARFYSGRGEPEDLAEAQHHLLQAENPEAAARSALKHGRDLIRSGARPAFLRILEALKEENVRSERAMELRFLEGYAADIEGEGEAALRLYADTVEEAKKARNAPLEAEARRLLGSLHLQRGNHEAADSELRRSLKLAERMSDLDSQAEAYYSLGFLRNVEGEFMEAYRAFRKGYRRVQKTGNRRIQAKLLYAFGVNYGYRGNYKKAVSYKMRARSILEEIRDLRQLTKVYVGLGASYYDLGDNAASRKFFDRAIAYATLLGDHRLGAYAQQNLASVLINEGDLSQARDLVEAASATFHRIGERRKVGWSHLHRGIIDFLQNESDAALEEWQSGLESLKAAKDRRGISLFNLTIGRLYADHGDVVAAASHLKEAEKAAKALGSKDILARVAEAREEVEALSREEPVPGGAKGVGEAR